MKLISAALLSALPAALGAYTVTSAGTALRDISTAQTTSVVLSLEACDVTFPNGVTVWTRCFNGTIPGPTIRAKAGTTLKVKIVNTLGDHDAGVTYQHNTYGHPNMTNMHTHGLHVTADSPGDDVFVHINPGEEHEYSYEIGADHMGGTHWYHPHSHGSTALQAGGGALGMLIIDDLDEEVPPEIAAMEEKLIALSHLPATTLTEIEESSFGNLWKPTGTVEDTVLANGQQTPDIAMTTNQWYRFRIMFASVEDEIRAAFDSDNCEMQLLAKDGVYLRLAPRAINDIPFSLGGRADVAVRCTSAGSYILQAGAAARRRSLLQRGGAGGEGGPDDGAPDFAGDLLTLTVTDGGVTATELKTFNVIRGCYQADLTCAAASDVAKSFALTLGGGGLTINGESYTDSDTSLTGGDFDVGTVAEWTVDGSNAHPFHLHVNPYQIQELTTTDTDYYQVGDWHDVILGPTNLKIRINHDKFATKAVVHCHILDHEDRGMMAFVNINGAEGTEWAGARVQDPTCTLDATRGWAYSTSAPACTVGVIAEATSSTGTTPTTATTTGTTPTAATTTGTTPTAAAAFSGAGRAVPQQMVGAAVGVSLAAFGLFL